VVEAINADTPATSEAVPVLPAIGPGDVPVHEGAHGEASVPVSEPALPGIDSDQGHEVATLQTLWRPSTIPAEAPRAHVPAHPDVPAAQGDFALPDALLAPATLTGLRTEPAMTWSLPTPSTPWQPMPAPAERRRQPREPAEQRRQSPRDETDHEPTHSTQPHERAPDAPQTVIDADDAGDWCEALSRGLQAQLTQLIVPPALLAAASDGNAAALHRALACPQGLDPAGPPGPRVVAASRCKRPARWCCAALRVGAACNGSPCPRQCRGAMPA
jgi:hypothetical protein